MSYGGERGARCVYYACAKRRDVDHRWWVDYGACCYEHAVLHYGEECVE